MKFKWSLVLVMVVGVCSFSKAQQAVGKKFPVMATETADNKKVNLPGDSQDKYTLLGLAYSKKSEQDLTSWFSPVYQKFVYKPKKPGLFSAFAYDINVFFIPMFTGVKAAATGAAKKNAMKNLDPRLLPHVLFYKGDLKKYKEKLNFTKKDIPYFFVVDTAGKIVYATSGKYTEEKMDAIEEFLDDL